MSDYLPMATMTEVIFRNYLLSQFRLKEYFTKCLASRSLAFYATSYLPVFMKFW